MARPDFVRERAQLVRQLLPASGIKNPRVLQAIADVPREEFVPDDLQDFAYRNSALPIAAGQTISQPAVVAAMLQSVDLKAGDRVLEIGTGSGYAAAVLSRLVEEVYTVERIAELASSAAEKFDRLGYRNIQVRQADGSLGWPQQAPFDAIVVSAAGPAVPAHLLNQLRIGGRLVMPVGTLRREQKLVRIVRQSQDQFRNEELGEVCFVPLIGQAGWPEESTAGAARQAAPIKSSGSLTATIQDVAEPFSEIDTANLQPLMQRIGDARVVLIGEASHGTSEFYRMRARITQALIEQKGFQFVAVEADWPDAHRIHDYVTHQLRADAHDWEAFSRFPKWMWRNHEVLDFIEWLRAINWKRPAGLQRVGFYGLDLYSLFTSIDRVVRYLDKVDPEAANVARDRYGCLTPWQEDPVTYGRLAYSGRFRGCEQEVALMLRDIVAARLQSDSAGDDFFDAQLNARLIANAERYYRMMYAGSDESWNARDRHMFEALQLLLNRYGNQSKAIVWEHNSHLGDAAATEFGQHGQLNVGQLCREHFGADVYAIGQGTDHGAVAAASRWDGKMQVMSVRPALPHSFERMMHLTEIDRFFLPLTKSDRPDLRDSLGRRLERAIGVIYRPETERQSHYFNASLADQFDEWIWFDETTAVRRLETQTLRERHPSHPFAIIDA